MAPAAHLKQYALPPGYGKERLFYALKKLACGHGRKGGAAAVQRDKLHELLA